MWDFGFALARSAPWEVALGNTLQPTMEAPKSTNDLELLKKIVPFKEGGPDETVGRVYQSLKNCPDSGYVSWRKFFGACRTVADAHHEQTGAPAVAFDIAAPSSETINTLLLEIWFSELLLEDELRKNLKRKV